MAKQWYVIHTYSGYEHKARAALEERVRTLGKQDLFGDVLVPAEKVVELVKGRKKTSSRKFFPGYILVNMELNDETWHIVKSTPKVTGFVGDATHPEPISEAEVQEITQQMAEGAARPKPKVLFESGENVKVIDGPFADFNGVVEEVKPDKGKLRVLISIFGRATPVELDFVQVEKA
jgi:transcriptional antiterminator NusG